MLLEIRNNFITLKFDNESKNLVKYIKKELNHDLNPLDPARFHSVAFTKYHTWDGRTTIYDMENDTVPTGLYNNLMDSLGKMQETNDLKVETEDLQGKPLTAKVPDKIHMSGEGVKALDLRDYQIGAIKSIAKHKRGLLDISTNGGKSSIAITAFDLLTPKLNFREKALFIAPNKSIMNQLKDNFEGYLGTKVGVWGDGKKDLEPQIVCATIQSIASAIKKPKIKLTKKDDKLLERLVTVHAPKILGSNPKNSLNMYVKTYIPKYKYEQEDVKTLQGLANTLRKDQDVVKFFKDSQKDYEKILLKKDRKGFKKYHEALDFLEQVRVVFADECQSASADSYQKVFALLENAQIRIGMSGTIDTKQKDKYYKIKAILGEPIYTISNEQMIEKTFSAKPHIKMLSFNDPPDLEEQVHRLIVKNQIPKYQQALYRYQQSYRLGVIENDKRNRLIARLAIRLSQQDDKVVLVMVNSIEHGEHIADYLEQEKMDYAFVQGADSSEVREDVLNKVRSGTLKILLATKIFDAGIDVPNLKYFVSCSGGKSYVQNLQRIGRLLRTQEDKHDIYIYDIWDRNSEYLYKQGLQRRRYYKDEKFEVS